MDWISLLGAYRYGDVTPRNPDATRNRSMFEQDYDRVLFSSAFRRLQDKTQVIPLPEEDFVHNRLTHSIEVSSVGRTLGKMAGQQLIEKYPELETEVSSWDISAIVAAASLAHDIGNPPFGHSGEAAIGEFFSNGPGQIYESRLTDKQWHDLVHYEGNAGGFRILTRGNNEASGGLRLSYPTLGAFTKYPKESLPILPKGRASEKKFGFFQSERELFRDLAIRLELQPVESDGHLHYRRHPLVFLVEAADDTCYHIIDFEDGLRLRWIDFREAEELLIPIAGKSFFKENYTRITDPDEKAAYLRATAINGLIREAVELFMQHEPEMLNGNFDAALLDQSRHKEAMQQIRKLSVNKIYRARSVVEIEAAGFEVIGGLLHHFIKAFRQVCGAQEKESARNRKIAELLPAPLQNPGIKIKQDTYLQLIAVCEFVAGLTDKHAISLFRKLNGIEIPRG